jgi:tripartite-type tricarboxylate transporter receptor subunit TctC
MTSVSRLSPAALFLAALLAAALLGRPDLGQAQPRPYFEGKTITIYVTNPAGGGFDLNARLLARHLGDYIPGHPTVIVSNMPGAHGVTGANFIYNIAPKDGTALGAPVPYLPQYQVQGIAGPQYDAAKFGWLGSIGAVNEIMYVWHTVPVRSVGDLQNHETILAADGAVVTFARLLTATVGARFKLVKGYGGTKEAHLALERGEVEGAVSTLSILRAYWSDWFENGKVRIILTNAFKRDPDIPDVPATIEFAKTQADRDLIGFFIASTSIGRAFVTPPDLAPDVLATLRTAFAATVKDEAFIAECRQAKFDVTPRSGEELQSIVNGMINVTATTRERIREIAGNEL